ncbi:hypothetical protein O3P69_020971 [Scylla paramamosain]|uniref:Uncharacterized protein n=1 Tax=Scylla paramamosain TaxID=85552 RepID=A0AAW0SFV3_SCYPA
MSSFEELKRQAIELGLSGAEIGQYVAHQQAYEREERTAERQARKEEAEQQERLELARLATESERMRLSAPGKPEAAARPKLLAYQDGEDIAAYLTRFERVAELLELDKGTYAVSAVQLADDWTSAHYSSRSSAKPAPRQSKPTSKTSPPAHSSSTPTVPSTIKCHGCGTVKGSWTSSILRDSGCTCIVIAEEVLPDADLINYHRCQVVDYLGWVDTFPVLRCYIRAQVQCVQVLEEVTALEALSARGKDGPAVIEEPFSSKFKSADLFTTPGPSYSLVPGDSEATPHPGWRTRADTSLPPHRAHLAFCPSVVPRLTWESCTPGLRALSPPWLYWPTRHHHCLPTTLQLVDFTSPAFC